jgi:hypothetical protein
MVADECGGGDLNAERISNGGRSRLAQGQLPGLGGTQHIGGDPADSFSLSTVLGPCLVRDERGYEEARPRSMRRL